MLPGGLEGSGNGLEEMQPIEGFLWCSKLEARAARTYRSLGELALGQLPEAFVSLQGPGTSLSTSEALLPHAQQ